MSLRHIVVATTLALVGATLAVSPAQASPVPEHPARDGDHYPASVTGDVPPGGTLNVTSPTIGKDVKTLTVTVKPKNADATSGDTYDRFVNTIGTLSKGQRLLVCTMMYQSLVAPQDQYTDEFNVDAYYATIAGAVLLACLQLAGLVTNQQTAKQARSSVAKNKCGQIRPSLPATVKKVDGGYSVKASGKSKKAKKPKLKVKCKVSGDTVKYTIRAKKKGQSLRKAAGKQLSLGMLSPSDAESSVPVKVTFNTP